MSEENTVKREDIATIRGGRFIGKLKRVDAGKGPFLAVELATVLDDYELGALQKAVAGGKKAYVNIQLRGIDLRGDAEMTRRLLAMFDAAEAKLDAAAVERV